MMTYHNRLTAAVASASLVVAMCILSGQARAASPQNSGENAIVTDIEAKLFMDPVLKTLNIHVASQGGVVTLSGTVNTNGEKADVERIASQEPGVKQVVDNLTVSGQPAAGALEATASAPTPPAKVNLTVPAGTPITVQMIDAVDTAKNKPGDEFDGSIYSPVVVGNYVAVPQYAKARLRLVDAASAGHLKGRSELALELVSLTVNGTLYEVESNYYEQQGNSRGTQTGERTAGGGILGALIGAAAAGGKGAGIGAIVGTAAGIGAQAATRGQQIKVASEAKVNFILKAPVTIASASPVSAMAAVVAPLTPTPSSGLAGTWMAYFDEGFGVSGHLKVDVRQAGERLVGYIVGGDHTMTNKLPVGKELFYGTYNSDAIDGQQICAGPNYSAPMWTPLTLKVIDNDHLRTLNPRTCFYLRSTVWERVSGGSSTGNQ